MPFIKVYIHFVWSTKNREPYLNSKELRTTVWNHIKEHAKNKGIFIDFISGYNNHCHCLVSLGANQTIQKIMQLIKGESSFWINKNNLTPVKFAWQNDYYGVAVCDAKIDTVRNYIKNQEKHHAKKSYKQELDTFINEHDFKKYNDFE